MFRKQLHHSLKHRTFGKFWEWNKHKNILSSKKRNYLSKLFLNNEMLIYEFSSIQNVKPKHEKNFQKSFPHNVSAPILLKIGLLF